MLFCICYMAASVAVILWIAELKEKVPNLRLGNFSIAMFLVLGYRLYVVFFSGLCKLHTNMWVVVKIMVLFWVP